MIEGVPAPFATDREAAKGHMDRIAVGPRMAGSSSEQAARDYCRTVLEGAGFLTSEEPFEFSAFPGRHATTLGGLCSIVVLLAVACLGYAGRTVIALTVLLVVSLAMAALAAWVASHGVLDLGWHRSGSVNLTATRGTPRLWLMAHIDTKSQPVSMAARVTGIVASVTVWMSAIALAAAGTIMQLPEDWRMIGWPVIGLAGVLAGLPVAASRVGDHSPGAFDNASGVATVLLVATTLPIAVPLGIAITSAEELGMAGARAWVLRREAGVAINCDGVGDAGALTAMTTSRGSKRLAAAFDRSATAAVVPHRVVRLVPGILVDAIALADAGWESITISHGSLRSLASIHTPGDTADRLTGAGVVKAAAVVGAMALELA